MSRFTIPDLSATLGPLASMPVEPTPALAPETSTTGPGRCALQADDRHRKPPPTVWDRLNRIWRWSEVWDAYRHDHQHGTDLKTATELLVHDPTHTRPVKVLTVWQPWASCIAAAATNPAGKTTENRDWETSYRGLVAIHAGKSTDTAALEYPWVRETLHATGWAQKQDLPHGGIVALANLTGCHKARSGTAARWPAAGCCRPWGDSRAWHWELTGVARLAKPVPCRGFVGLFDPPSDVRAAIAEQLVIL